MLKTPVATKLNFGKLYKIKQKKKKFLFWSEQFVFVTIEGNPFCINIELNLGPATLMCLIGTNTYN